MENMLTIVLPLKDRTPFTWRWMEYADQMKFPFHIIIADGGKDPVVEKKLTDKSNYPNLDYEYIRYPYDKDIPIFFKKMNDAVSHVQTKYVILTDNDDFLFVEALHRAIEFLEKNDDFSSSRGEVYDFQVSSKDKSLERKDVYGKMISFRKILTSDSNVGETALIRVRTFSEHADGMWQDVCRTKNLKECYQTLVDSNIADLQLCDHLIDYLRVTYGKIHRGGGLYMLHQSHIGGLGHKMIRSDPLLWIMSEYWPEDISKMFKLIASKISRKDNLPEEYANHRMMQYYISHIIGANMIQGRLKRKIATEPPKIVTLGRIFHKDNKIRKSLKNLYQYVYNLRQDWGSHKVLASSHYYNEIKIVQDFLLNK